MTGGPAARLEDAVELLERSLSFTRVLLADVSPGNLERPTPCAGWTLERLLAHMEDALDAFTEAAAGRVEVAPVPVTATRVDALREKACVLLGAWAAAPPRPEAVAVGDLDLEAPLLVATAALEITVHGWDVGQATGRCSRIPADLAGGLLTVAEQVIDPTARGPEFAGPLPAPAGSAPDVRLLAWTGRAPRHMTEPPGGNPGEPPARGGPAS